jgi:hypothetical protein
VPAASRSARPPVGNAATFNHTQFSAISQQAKFASATNWTQVDPLFLQPTAAKAARTMQITVRVNF